MQRLLARVALASCLLVALTPYPSTAILQSYVIQPGEVIERCGGLTGGCEFIPIAGAITFEIDFASAIPAVPSPGDVIPLTLTGRLFSSNGPPFSGTDDIVIEEKNNMGPP